MTAPRRAPRKNAGAADPSRALREFALALPGTDEGVACEGTSLEKRTIRAGTKAFLFLGPGDAMLKLRESLAEAKRYAAKDPAGCRAGKGGWVTVRVGAGCVVPIAVLETWIAESHRLQATPGR